MTLSKSKGSNLTNFSHNSPNTTSNPNLTSQTGNFQECADCGSTSKTLYIIT